MSVLLPPPPHQFRPTSLFVNPHKTLRTTARRRHPLRCCSSSSSVPTPPSSPEPSSLSELPIFPLPLVLFPGAILPLQIFEFRYRIMMHTLLQTDLRFGVLLSSSSNPAPSVGCVAEVVKHERLADDRFFLIAKGQERFRISSIARTKPYLVANVSFLEDRPPPPPPPPSTSSDDDEDDNIEALATQVETLMKDVIRISNRLNGNKKKKNEEDEEESASAAADLRKGQFPTMFSFFVGSTFEGAPKEQQALLEMEDTRARLKREKETLKNTLNYLTAAAAVKDVFPSSPSSSSS